MTQIRFKQSITGTGLTKGSREPFDFFEGIIADVESELADKWIASGIAEAFVAAPEMPQHAPVPEIQVMTPPENTMRRRGRPKLIKHS